MTAKPMTDVDAILEHERRSMASRLLSFTDGSFSIEKVRQWTVEDLEDFVRAIVRDELRASDQPTPTPE